MADFNHHLKNNKILVFFTIFAFLYMSCFSSCSKPKNQEKTTELAQKSARGEASKINDIQKVESPTNIETAKSDKSAQSDKSDDPCAGCPPGVNASDENAGQKKPLTQEELNQMADKLDRYFQTLAEAVKEIPRDTFDPQAIVDKVGKDPEALFQWLRDNTRLVPYQGILRGPVGVLMDRFGNSLDRALLLHELLRLAGYETRLARGTLSDKLARDSFTRDLDRAKKTDSSFPEYPPSELDKYIEQNSDRYQVDQKEFKETILQLIKEHDVFSQKLIERSNRQAALVAKAVEKFRQKKSSESIDLKPDLLKDHWWAQIEKDGQWLDFDPDHSDGEPGKSWVDAEETFQPQDLSPDLFHQVKIRVIVERWAAEGHEEKIALDHDLNTADLFEKRLALSHLPLDWQKTFDVLEKPEPQELLKLNLLKEKEWLPVLTVGAERFYQYGFNDKGEILKSPSKQSSRGGVGGIAGGLLGGLAGREPDAETESRLTAEWIEYEISSPGVAPAKVRRQIFDLIGPTARQQGEIPSLDISDFTRLDRCLRILSGKEIFIQVCHLSPAFILNLEAKNLMANRDIIMNLIRHENPSSLKEMLETAQQLSPLPGSEYGFAYARHDLSKYKDAIYLDRPNIFNLTHGVQQNPRGEIYASFSFDIVTNSVSVYPQVKEDPFFVNLYQGVADTNAEALLIDSSGRNIENTAEIFAQSESLGIEWRTIRDASSKEWKEVDLPQDVRSRVEENLHDGYIVIVPQKSIRKEGQELSGWWRVNPQSGNVLGMGADGSGQATSEYMVVLEKILFWTHVAANLVCWWEFFRSKSVAGAVARFLLCIAMGLFSTGLHVAVSGGQIVFGAIFFGIPLFTLDRILHVLHGL